MDNILNALIQIYENDEDLYRIKDVCVSLTNSQKKSKQWLVNNVPYLKGNTLIIGGWYGLLASMVEGDSVKSIDLDPDCERYGRMLFPNVDFITGCGFAEAMKYEYDNYICTACEHILQEDLDMLIGTNPRATFIFQSNDYVKEVSHINCKNSLEEFISEYNFGKVSFKDELDIGIMKRFMVVGHEAVH